MFKENIKYDTKRIIRMGSRKWCENYKIKVKRSDNEFQNTNNIDFDTNMVFIVPLKRECVVVLIQ